MRKFIHFIVPCLLLLTTLLGTAQVSRAAGINLNVYPIDPNPVWGEHFGYIIQVDNGSDGKVPISGQVCINRLFQSGLNKCTFVQSNGIATFNNFQTENLAPAYPGGDPAADSIDLQITYNREGLAVSQHFYQKFKQFPYDVYWRNTLDSQSNAASFANGGSIDEIAMPTDFIQVGQTAVERLYMITDKTSLVPEYWVTTYEINKFTLPALTLNPQPVYQNQHFQSGQSVVINNLTVGIHYFIADIHTSRGLENTSYRVVRVIVQPSSGANSMLIVPPSPKPHQHSVITTCKPSLTRVPDCTTVEVNTGPLFDDGRLNDGDGAENVAVYCNRDKSVTLLNIDNQHGVLAFIASPAEIGTISDHPTVNTLIKQNMGTRLYRLTSGELQVNRAYPDNTTDYVFRFRCS